MDFWTRLIGGGLSSSRGLRRNTAAGERLTRFKQICNSLYQLWRTNPSASPDSPAIAHIQTCLTRLNSILSDESRGPAPHPCLAFAATSQVYLTVAKLALSSCDPVIISHAALLFNTLIEAEVDGIIDNRVFARAVVDLVRQAGFAGEEGEARLVELIFGVANNIRLRPDILPAWFVPKEKKEREREHPDQADAAAGPAPGAAGSGLGVGTAAEPPPSDTGTQEFAGAMRKDDFPLFYLLVDYVHREGRPGDFARTGVLYIIETASRSSHLQRWLIESDLATLMATGLGAQYSQLSRSSASSDTDDIPHVIALSDHAHLSTAVHRDSEEQMHAFLTYLLFWQDAIDYCKSVEVNDTLLDHFQVLFLEQLLYPSLLESSDVDGGSTSAVTNYLSQILESVDQPALIHRILHFLLASPSDQDNHAQPSAALDKKSPMYPSRRKSLDMLAQFAEAAPKPSPALFNLVDLVLVNIRSKHIQTVTATLRLISVIVRRHQPFTGPLFKSLQRSESPAQPRTVGAFNTELQNLMSMATAVLDDPSIDEAYDSYLASASLIVYPNPDLQLGGGDGDGSPSRPLTVLRDDALIAGIMDMLAHFFTNSVMTNLALTNVVAALTSSSCVSLDRWLLVHPDEYQYSPVARKKPEPSSLADPPPHGGDSNNEPESDPFVEYEQPQWPPKDVPALSSILQALVRQVELWRQEISDFDVLLAARRDVLTSEDNDPSPSDEVAARSATPQTRGQASLDPGAGRPSTPPRGRKTSSILERLGGGASPKQTPTPDRSKSAASKSADPSSSRSRTRSHARSSQVAKDLRKRVVVNLADGSLPRGATELSPMRSDTASVVDTSAPPSEISEFSEREEGSEPAAVGRRGPGDGKPGEATRDDVASGGVTVGHILTNAVILYEFILELTALVQVRASVLDEVSYGS